ncbi:MAG: F0F1 ATP synthase subunit epsilon [Actinomycetota bacterium]
MGFQVEFVSPETTLYSDRATQVVARTRGGGDIAFLTGHEPFIGSLLTCEVRVTEEEGGAIKRFAVRGGFVSVTGTMSETKITVLSDAAQPADEIDQAEAQADLDAAREVERANPDDPYARDDIRWAEIRLQTIGAEVG